MSEQLSFVEISELERYERVIADGLQTFMTVGQALIAIRQGKLYRQRYDTFEAYCREHWDMDRTYAHRVIAAAKVAENLLPIGNILPVSESQARPLIALEPDAQREVWQAAVETAPNGHITAAHVQDTVERYYVSQQPEPMETPPFPTSTYRCLVIDPPWPVEKIIREVRPHQGQSLDYPTMDMEEIEALPIPTLAEPTGCHVYLWVTHHFLHEGLHLFEAWGVRYQCQLTWNKNVGITPFSWMYDTEHVLFGRIGHLDLLQNGLRLSFSEAVQGHSIKPNVFYERVRDASPGPRLEMFARTAHDGFQPWGAEAPIVP